MSQPAQADTTEVRAAKAKEMVDKFRGRVQKGRAKGNLGVPISLKGIDRYLHGVQQARYYLMGADSGIGKSSLGDFVFLLELWLWCRDNKRQLRVPYYSFEISGEQKIALWCSYFVSVLRGVDIPTDYIMGYIMGSMVIDEHMEMIEEALLVIEELLKVVTIYDTPKNPTAIFHDLIDLAEELGEVKREERENKRKLDEQGKPTIDKYIVGYEQDDPNLLVMVMLDHAALCMPESGMDLKRTIDRLSSYFVFIRNKFRFSMLLIQQFNTEMQSVERRKFTQAAFAPQRSDYGDSKYSFRDCDCAFGLIKPSFFDLATFHDYSIFRKGDAMYELGDSFMACFLMKNRYGPSGKMIPLFMNGITKRFEDLPTVDDEFTLIEFGERAKQLEKEWQLHSQQNPAQSED